MERQMTSCFISDITLPFVLWTEQQTAGFAFLQRSAVFTKKLSNKRLGLVNRRWNCSQE
jgi:hypothetical protein